MERVKLIDYLEREEITQSDLSRMIGQSRQRVSNWVRDGATVELTPIGLRIRAKNDRILHESQVAK